MFEGCYTQQEIKDRYKQLSKKLHPDVGGTKEQFQGLQKQYEEAQYKVSRSAPLPELYKMSGKYTYYNRKVSYVGKDNHWYRFAQEKGADIKVDSNHLYVIKDQGKWI